ncbi:MAG: helix-turn-helix domain-containing protein [Balneolaceae bacterium]
MPLIILVGQGYLFALILIGRFIRDRKTSDALLSLLLIITGLRCTAYMIGFMGWYDDYPTTKVNYFLVDFSLVLGPLIYFYVKSITIPQFKFLKKDIWHFVPWVLFLVFRITIYLYDVQQPGFDEVQNGVLDSAISVELGFFIYITGLISRLIYFYFAIQVYFQFRKKISQFFSNTYKVELNWLRNFLVTYSFLFILKVIFVVVNDYVVQLSWKQNWWWYFVASLVLVYLGMMGIFSDVGKLSELKPVDEKDPETQNKGEDLEPFKKEVLSYMMSEKAYLNADLTLNDLAKELSIPTNVLSRVINSGFGKNFNDFINEFRIEEVKKSLKDDSLKHLSLLGIAFDCGFNSKATFNRVFKKVTGYSPSQYQIEEGLK